jgi:paraquat-inducible protein A
MTIASTDCGALETLPPLPHGSTALCRLCRGTLELTNGRSLTAGLACSLSALLLLFPANLAPFMSVSILGQARAPRLGAGVSVLWIHHWVLLAVLIGLFAVVLPFVRFGFLSVVLAALRLGFRPSWLGRIYRYAIHMDLWAMPDVFLIGAAIGYSRISVRLHVSIGAGGYCFIAVAALMMLSRAVLDRRKIWRMIGGERAVPPGQAVISCTICDLVMPASAEGTPCPRCGLILHARLPYSMMRTAALVAAGFILFIPANIYPMQISAHLGQTKNFTIFAGITDLFQAGLAPLGVVIFTTSIAIPLLKLAGLCWFMVSIRIGSRKHLVLKTRLFRIIDEIGRWSNIDPFTVAVIVPLFYFPPLVETHAGIGAPAFLLVVVLTMFASQFFDPRLMWDAAAKAAP